MTEENDYVAIDKEVKDVMVNNYEEFNIRWWGHLILAIAGYAVASILSSVFYLIFVSAAGLSGIPGDELTDAQKVQCNHFSTYGTCLAYIVVIAAFVIIFRKKILKILKGFGKKKTYVYAFMCFGFIMAFSYVYNIILTNLGVVSTSTNQDLVENTIFSQPLVGFLFICILAPLFEELIFRFGLFRAFQGLFAKHGKAGDIIALAITTFIFAMAHMVASIQMAFIQSDITVFLQDLTSLPLYLFGAFFLTFSYYKSKSLACSMFTHMFYNTISFVTTIIVGIFATAGEVIMLIG